MSARDRPENAPFASRLASAVANPRFRVIMLAWSALLVGFLFFPDPTGLSIDSHVYRNAFQRMAAGEDAYLVPDPDATRQSAGRAIYYFPPPPAAVVAGPISSLPSGPLWWLLANLGLTGASFLVMRSLTPPIPKLRSVLGRAAVPIAVAAWFLFGPSLQQLLFANQQSLLLLATSVFAFGLFKDRPVLTGLGLAVAVLIKASPALFALPLLASRRFRELGWSMLFGVLGIALTLPVIGLKPWLDFAHALLTGSDIVATQGYNMAPLAGALPAVPHLVWIGLTGAAMLLAGRLPVRELIVVSIALFLLGWPVQWLHYATIALVALTILLPDRRTWLALAAAYLLFGVWWRVAWLPATGLLVVAALRPDWIARVQAFLARSLSPTGHQEPYGDRQGA